MRLAIGNNTDKGYWTGGHRRSLGSTLQLQPKPSKAMQNVSFGLGFSLEAKMDVVGIRNITSHRFWVFSGNPESLLSSSSSSSYPFIIFCSKRGVKKPKENGDNKGKGDKFSTDWNKAWSNFRKQGKKTFFSGFSPDKYVSWNPRRSDFPLSEEVDPIKRTERSNLMLWTSPRFTLAGAIVIVSFLLVYTILLPAGK